jgi:hypothetical protein
MDPQPLADRIPARGRRLLQHSLDGAPSPTAALCRSDASTTCSDPRRPHFARATTTAGRAPDRRVGRTLSQGGGGRSRERERTAVGRLTWFLVHGMRAESVWRWPVAHRGGQCQPPRRPPDMPDRCGDRIHVSVRPVLRRLPGTRRSLGTAPRTVPSPTHVASARALPFCGQGRRETDVWRMGRGGLEPTTMGPKFSLRSNQTVTEWSCVSIFCRYFREGILRGAARADSARVPTLSPL